jgi:ubiquitin carboxyl-terminal hydrolase L3
MAPHQKWFPLESNPALINTYVQNLGFETSHFEFCDVFSTEDWALDMVPQPVAAVIMLYPLTDKQLAYKDETEIPAKDAPHVWFTKQRIGNACGTIGLLHALLNAPEVVRSFIKSSSWLASFHEDCPAPLDPIAKAERLEGDDKIATLHDQATSSEQNQTGRGNLDDQLITHFITLVCVGNRLYELDGRKSGPVDHGPTTPETLLKDSCKVVQAFMNRDPGELRYVEC